MEPNIRPAQDGKRMSQGLHGVRERARSNKQERFTTLLHHMTTGILRDSFYALKRKAAPGVDGMTWQEYETGLEERLVDLHSRVHRGAYRAQPSKRHWIRKANGQQRPLGIGRYRMALAIDRECNRGRHLLKISYSRFFVPV